MTYVLVATPDACSQKENISLTISSPVSGILYRIFRPSGSADFSPDADLDSVFCRETEVCENVTGGERSSFPFVFILDLFYLTCFDFIVPNL